MEKLKYWKEFAGKINITTTPGDFRVAVCAEESCARRIVACMNATEGIETEWLELHKVAPIVNDLKTMHTDFATLRAQNARLLEALKNLLDFPQDILDAWEKTGATITLTALHFQQARAAIAEAEKTEKL